MTGRPVFLSVEEVIELHARLMAEFGGDPSIRDRGLLESAVSIPKATFDGALLHESAPAMAAAYLFHVRLNHPFVDGNKRTALATAEVFLLLNDVQLTADNAALYELTVGVAASRVSKEEVTAFFGEHSSPAR